MPYRVVKQLKPAPTSSVDRNGNSMNDPAWASRNIWVGKLSGSNDQVWEFSGSNAEAQNHCTGSQGCGWSFSWELLI